MGLHVGVLGAGFVGRVHLDALRAHPAISAISIAEPDPATRESAATGWSPRRVEADHRALVDDPSVDIIDICLPHDLHAPVALEAFAAGRHVFTDKPIANTMPEADAMIAAAEAAGRRLYVALNERSLPVHAEVRRLLEDGDIGRPTFAQLTVAGTELARMRIPGHWKGTLGRAGGGALADSGTHVVDLAQWWFGVPEAVTCRLANHAVDVPGKADDTAVLVMEYPALTVAISVTYAAGGQPWSELRSAWSETGSLHVRLEADEPLTVWSEGRRIDRPVEHQADWWAWSVRRGLSEAIDRFVADEPFDVTPEDARLALRTIRAAYDAAAAGRRIELASWPGDR